MAVSSAVLDSVSFAPYLADPAQVFDVLGEDDLDASHDLTPS